MRIGGKGWVIDHSGAKIKILHCDFRIRNIFFIIHIIYNIRPNIIIEQID